MYTQLIELLMSTRIEKNKIVVLLASSAFFYLFFFETYEKFKQKNVKWYNTYI